MKPGDPKGTALSGQSGCRCHQRGPGL